MAKEKARYTGKIILQTLILFLISIAGSIETSAQEITLEARRITQISVPQNAIRHMLIETATGVQPGYISEQEGITTVALPGKKEISLPFRLPQIISYDGSTIIQFGDPYLLDEPQRLDVFWIDSEGKEKNRLVNHYGGDARLDVSADGFTSVGGSLLERQGNSSVSCYSPDGKMIWETYLKERRHISQIYAGTKGSLIITVTTDPDHWLKDFRLDIYDRSGNQRSSIKDLGIIQRVVLIGNDRRIFFQGRESYGAIDGVSGKVLWRTPGKITMVSPYGASLSPDGRYLFTVVIGQEGRRSGPYHWKFVVLDISSGRIIGTQMLPDKYPATWERIFESVGNDSVTVIAGSSRINISIKTVKGGI